MAYGREITNKLIEFWQVNPRPSLNERRKLARETGLSSECLRKWFDRHQVKEWILTATHRKVLFRQLKNDANPSMETCQKIAGELALTEDQVSRWFGVIGSNRILSNVKLNVQQLRLLIKKFESNSYISTKDSIALSGRVNLSSNQVKLWFKEIRKAFSLWDHNVTGLHRSPPPTLNQNQLDVEPLNLVNEMTFTANGYLKNVNPPEEASGYVHNVEANIPDQTMVSLVCYINGMYIYDMIIVFYALFYS